MPLILIGLALVVLKVLDIEPLASIEWKYTVVPFVLAAVWWKFADATGITRRQQDRKEERRIEERRRRQTDALGTTDRRSGDRRNP